MNVVFFTREVPVCMQIGKILEGEGCTSRIMTDDAEFFVSLTDSTFKCDLLIVDYRAIPHQSFGIYRYLREKKFIRPLIFYNDPFPDSQERAEHWLHTNENLYQTKQFSHLLPFFNRLNEIIESPGIHPYVSLLQPPVNMYKADSPDKQIDLVSFRKRNHLSPVIFKIFSYFYSHLHREISVTELAKALWPVRKKQKRSISSIYSYISRLRKIIDDDALVKIDIVRTDTASYEMIIY